MRLELASFLHNPPCGSRVPLSLCRKAAIFYPECRILTVRDRNDRVDFMSDDNDKSGDGGSDTGVTVRTKPATKKPAMYKVLMLNDDYTPMEFVVHVLEAHFRKTREEATQVMLHVHRRGIGICGVYTYEVAETKVTEVVEFARRNEHPLQLTLEKD